MSKKTYLTEMSEQVLQDVISALMHYIESEYDKTLSTAVERIVCQAADKILKAKASL